MTKFYSLTIFLSIFGKFNVCSDSLIFLYFLRFEAAILIYQCDAQREKNVVKKISKDCALRCHCNNIATDAPCEGFGDCLGPCNVDDEAKCKEVC